MSQSESAAAAAHETDWTRNSSSSSESGLSSLRSESDVKVRGVNSEAHTEMCWNVQNVRGLEARDFEVRSV